MLFNAGSEKSWPVRDYSMQEARRVGRKGLRFSPDAAVEKWPLRGSPATVKASPLPTFPRQSLCSSPMEIGVRQYAGGAVMSDGLSKLYQELLSASYDCVDRIVLNAYFGMGHSSGWGIVLAVSACGGGRSPDRTTRWTTLT